MNTRTLKQHLKYKIPQIKLAILREPSSEPQPAIRTPNDLEQYLEPMKHLSEEHFVALHLNARNQVMGYHVVSHGTVSASLVHPREVFKAALLNNAYCLIVAHNHPAGSPDPSPDDINTTRQLVAAGKILGIEIIDHMIVSYRSVSSMRESHPYLF
jgi:DNA repair protein RadC